MTELSPTAQAVLKAVTQRQYSCDPSDVPEATGRIRYEAAAALRAAADQVVPVEYEDIQNCWYEKKNNVREQFLAIADELEGVTYGTYRCNLEDKPQ